MNESSSRSRRLVVVFPRRIRIYLPCAENGDDMYYSKILCAAVMLADSHKGTSIALFEQGLYTASSIALKVGVVEPEWRPQSANQQS